MSDKPDRADILDAVAEALDTVVIREYLVLAGVTETENEIVVEVLSPLSEIVDEYTIRVTKRRVQRG
jgi:hypothetical protein